MSEERLKEIKNIFDMADIYGDNFEIARELYNEVIRLREENEKIRKMNMYEHKYGSDMEEKYLIEKTKNDRAVEYIKEAKNNEKNNTMEYYKYSKEDLLNILNGKG